MPTTTNYSITLPTVGGDKNTWGSTLNSAFTVLEQKTYDVDTTLGDVSDSATPSLAYNLAQASTNASTALSVSNKSLNTTLTTLTSRVSALETLVGDVGTSGSVADDARTAKTTAQSAYTAATT
jgi:uncharacterized protein YlxW (UPF0749 family)